VPSQHSEIGTKQMTNAKSPTYFKSTFKSHNNCSKCGKEFSGENASGNLKKHEKIF
jgi:hypothetical protein